MSIIKRITKKKTAADDKAQVEVAETAAPKKPAAKRATKKKVVAREEKPSAVRKTVSPLVSRTLLAPIVTEKSATLADAGVYAFLVPDSANRVTVGQAFRELYKVTPTKVNIVRVHGKEHRFGTVMSRRADWKKALVSVPKGTRIDIFEQI